jgi:hypothetical protein
MLEVDRLLTPLERETSRRKLPDGSELRTQTFIEPHELVSQSLTVHGTLDQTGELVTLPAAFTVGGMFPMFGTGPQSQQLQSFYVLFGAHVDGTSAPFTRVRVRLRHLDAWAALPGFTLTHDRSGDEVALTFAKPAAPSAQLVNGARVILEQVAEWSRPTVGGGRLGRQVWLDILDMPPATYLELERCIVKPLMNLLTLAVGTECPLVTVMVSAGPEDPWLTVHHAAEKEPEAEIIPSSRMLLPLAEIGMEGVAAWLESSVSLGPLPSVVARVVSSLDDTLEAQLLELTTVAEGIHRLLLPKRTRMTKAQAKEARSKALQGLDNLPEDVQAAVQDALGHLTDLSYPRRLLDLADYVKDAVPGVTGNTAEWKKRVVNVRNGFAHQLEDGFLNEETADESVAVFLSLQWLLTGMLLLQTGISPSQLGNRLTCHDPYRLFLDQARAWLPAVYDDRQAPDR